MRRGRPQGSPLRTVVPRCRNKAVGDGLVPSRFQASARAARATTRVAPRVPGMGMDLQSEKRLPEVVTTTVVKPKVRAGDRRAGRRVNRRDDRTNRNGQRGQARAMSVLGTTKSDRHRKARGVESDGPARQSMHLTRGDLPVERRAEVSRGHSSDEGRESGWSEGPKAQETGWQPDSGPSRKLPERSSGDDRGRGTGRWIPAGEPAVGGGGGAGGRL